MQQPLVAGVAGGVGTTTLAMALRSRDCGVYQAGAPVDVLVTRATMSSLGCAQRALTTTPSPPVLAVVAAVPGSAVSRPVRARLRMTEAHIGALVLVPFVPEWMDCIEPHREASGRLNAPTPATSRPLRGFDAALHELVEHISTLLQARARLVTPSYAPPHLSPSTTTAVSTHRVALSAPPSRSPR